MNFLKRVFYSMGRLKIILVFILISSFSLEVFCQEDSEEELNFISLKNPKKDKIISNELNSVSFKLSFMAPSIATEFKLSDRFSIELAAKMNVLIEINSTTSTSSSGIVLFPYPVAHIEPKWNYNIIKRLDMNKNIKGFSSNFLSLFASYWVKVSPNTVNALLIGPTWGIQRSFKNIGYFKLNTGLGYLHLFDMAAGASNYTPILILPIIDVQLGLIF